MSATTDALRPGVPPRFRRVLLVACVFGASWGGAIVYWRLSGGLASNRALGVMFAGLPALLLLAAWAMPRRTAMPANAGAAPVMAPAALATPVPAAAPPLAILSAALRVPHASSAPQLAVALAENRARAALDPELVDDGGFPLMSARCLAAEDETARAEFAAWLAHTEEPEPAFGDEQWRALVLAGAVVAELAQRAAASLAGRPLPVLELAPLLPVAWPSALCRAAHGWLVHKAVRAGWPRGQVRIADAAGTAAPAALLARLAQDADAASQAWLALALACDSAIGSEAIARWAQAGVVFSASHAQGIVPGEGAAGLLLASPRQVQAADAEAAAGAAVLFEVAGQARPADLPRRCDPALLAGLAEGLLLRAGLHAGAVKLVVADTGHRTLPAMELMRYAAVVLPGIEAGVLRAGLACGSCGAVPFMAALALARHGARARAGAVLCVGNEDADGCSVALVRPLPRTA